MRTANTMSLSFPDDLKLAADEAAAREGLTRSEYFRRLVEVELDLPRTRMWLRESVAR